MAQTSHQHQGCGVAHAIDECAIRTAFDLTLKRDRDRAGCGTGTLGETFSGRSREVMIGGGVPLNAIVGIHDMRTFPPKAKERPKGGRAPAPASTINTLSDREFAAVAAVFQTSLHRVRDGGYTDDDVIPAPQNVTIASDASIAPSDSKRDGITPETSKSSQE